MSIPVLLVTGFLGAGKTTFINQLLLSDHGLRIAAIVNDFGSINIDAELLDGTVGEVIGLKNGCICCSLQGDLLRTLKVVFGHNPTPQMIVIEASGVADPAGVVQSLIDPVIWNHARLETVACVIDAPDVAERADDPLWRAQVRGSDVICLAKTEGMSPEALRILSSRFAVQGKRHIFDLADPLPVEALFVEVDPESRDATQVPLHDTRFVHLEWQYDGRLNLDRFQTAMSQLAPGLLRAKGFLAFQNQEERMLFQLVGNRATLSRAAGQEEDGCKLVLIGDRKVFDAEYASHALNEVRVIRDAKET